MLMRKTVLEPSTTIVGVGPAAAAAEDRRRGAGESSPVVPRNPNDVVILSKSLSDGMSKPGKTSCPREPPALPRQSDLVRAIRTAEALV